MEPRVRWAVARRQAGDLADPAAGMARYAHVGTNLSDPAALAEVLARLRNHPAVDLAWAEPHTEPALLGFDPQGPRSRAPAAPADTSTGDFTGLQGYLDPAPAGIGALDVRSEPGARGAGVQVVDVEGGWLWSHEDLPTPFLELGAQINSDGWRYHGTAVVGVIRGSENAFGVTGIAPDCAVGHSSIGDQSTADAILNAADHLGPGDVIVIELHAAGPNATGSGQTGYVPMEFWQDNFDAIEEVSRRGIIVVEAAGNGSEDLDAPVYQGLFDPAQRHSGAILVGATDGANLAAAWFTNHGQRVDLNGWGFNVTTLSYGDLQGEPAFAETQWYTGTFNGTSSATPIVTGAVVGLVGMVRSALGIDLDGVLAADLLRATGTPVAGGPLIGERPDMVAAWAAAQAGIGELTGTVVEQGTGIPLNNVLVRVAGTTSSALSALDGTWRLPLASGPVVLEFSRFGYMDASTARTVPVGGTLAVATSLAPQARVDVRGTVYGNGQPLAAARIDPLDQLIAPVNSAGDGSFVLPAVPVELDERLLVFGVPGFGARVVPVSTVGATSDVVVSPALAPVVEDFEVDDGGFTAASWLWTRGTPPAAIPGAFDGTNVWGVGMAGAGYPDAEADTLTSRVFDLSGVAPGSYYLSFHYYCLTEANYDGVNLEVSADGGPFTLLAPVEGYRDLFLGGLGHEAGWSGETNRWTGTVFDIGAYTGGDFRFRLKFGSDGGVWSTGFFFDGVAFGAGLNSTPVGDAAPAARVARLRAWPTPFNPVVNIAWSLPSAGRVVADVHDLRGHRVRRLFDAPVNTPEGTLRWDGRDDAGRTLASGVYLVRLQGPDGSRATARVVLTK